ncbi:hypothetical protein A4X13_0g4323 [Tilletia indica]|uniref:Uncharacterized protein n=1 Tax=Tilletia indica TaxID=43049 RepID=A0A177T9K0_9BASI|nr:hypothetical protein A4X13_0g4323 [Tilletia indica]
MAVVVDVFHLAAYIAQTREYLNPDHLSHFIHLKERLACAFAEPIGSASSAQYSVSASSLPSTPGTMTANAAASSKPPLHASGRGPSPGPGSIRPLPPAQLTATPCASFPPDTGVSPTTLTAAPHHEVRSPPPTMARQPSTPLRSTFPSTAKDVHARPPAATANMPQVKDSTSINGLPASPSRQHPITPMSTRSSLPFRSSPTTNYLPLLAFPPLLGDGSGDSLPNPGATVPKPAFGPVPISPSGPHPFVHPGPAFLTATSPSTEPVLTISPEDAAELLKLFPELGALPLENESPTFNGIMTRSTQDSVWTGDLVQCPNTQDSSGSAPPTTPMTRSTQDSVWTADLVQCPNTQDSSGSAPPTTPPNAAGLPFAVPLGNDGSRRDMHRYRGRVADTPPSPSPMRGPTSSLLPKMLVRPYTPRKRSSKTTAPTARPPKHSKITAPRTNPSSIQPSE